MSKSPAGYYGPFGGRFVAETLVPALDELTDAFATIVRGATRSSGSGAACSRATSAAPRRSARPSAWRGPSIRTAARSGASG